MRKSKKWGNEIGCVKGCLVVFICRCDAVLIFRKWYFLSILGWRWIFMIGVVYLITGF